MPVFERKEADGFFNNVSIIGVGLIGGSLALALKDKKLIKKIIGYGRNEERLKKALELGIIDGFTNSIKEIAKAKLIILATPVGVFEKIVKEMAPYLTKGTILIDVGSVKESVVNKIERLLPSDIHFLGTHPIAGSDKTGFEYARKDLFEGSRVIITPSEKTDKSIVKKIRRLWEKVGANVEIMNASEHDKIYALMSHLPHLLSFCLVKTVAQFNEDFIKYAGSGFKDSTRIAKSSPEMWKDIFIMNKDKIIQCIDVFHQKLEEVKNLLNNKSEGKLLNFIEKAKKLREKID